MSSILNTTLGANQSFSRSGESIPIIQETPRSIVPLEPMIRKRKFEFSDDMNDDVDHSISMSKTPIKANNIDLLITPPGNSYYKRPRTVPSSPIYSAIPNTPRELKFNNHNNLSTPPSSSKNSPELNNLTLHKPSVLSTFNLLNGSSNYYGDTCYSFNLSSSSLNKSVESNIRASNWRDACQDKIKHEQNKQFKQFQMDSLKFKQSLKDRYKPTNLNPPKLFQPKLFPKFNKLHSFIDGQYQKYNSIVNYPFSYNDKFDEAQLNKDLNVLGNTNCSSPPNYLPLIPTNSKMVKLPPVRELLKISPMDKSVLHPLGLTNVEMRTFNDLSQYSVSLNGDSRQYYLKQLPKRMDFGPIQKMPSFHEQGIEEEDYEEESTFDKIPHTPNPNYYSEHNSVLYQPQSPTIKQQQNHIQQLTPPSAFKSRKPSSSANSRIGKKSNTNSRKSSFNSNRGRPGTKNINGPRTRSNSRERMTVDKLSTSSPSSKMYKNSNCSTSTVFTTELQRSPSVTSDDLCGIQNKIIVEEQIQHGHHSHANNSNNHNHHHHPAKKCLSCGSSNSPCWRPSWDPNLGQLCNSCGLRYRKTKARCLNDSCLRIPAKSEWGLMQRRGKGKFTVNEVELDCFKCLQCDFAMEVK